MRWKAKVKPAIRASRVVRRFLFWPHKYPISGYEGEQEWRCWERAYIIQIHGYEMWHNWYWAEGKTDVKGL